MYDVCCAVEYTSCTSVELVWCIVLYCAVLYVTVHRAHDADVDFDIDCFRI